VASLCTQVNDANALFAHKITGWCALAGDRVTLTPGGHVVIGSSVSKYNRYLSCYVPGVALGDCGQTLTDTEVKSTEHLA
jgi:hypothetical protein